MNQKSYKVVFKKSALKELEVLPDRIKQKIIDAIRLLALNPYTELLQIKKLRGSDGLFRFRIQEYRVIYVLEGRILKITVIKIGHRKEVYSSERESKIFCPSFRSRSRCSLPRKLSA